MLHQETVPADHFSGHPFQILRKNRALYPLGKSPENLLDIHRMHCRPVGGFPVKRILREQHILIAAHPVSASPALFRLIGAEFCQRLIGSHPVAPGNSLQQILLLLVPFRQPLPGKLFQLLHRCCVADRFPVKIHHMIYPYFLRVADIPHLKQNQAFQKPVFRNQRQAIEVIRHLAALTLRQFHLPGYDLRQLLSGIGEIGADVHDLRLLPLCYRQKEKIVPETPSLF